MRQKVTELERVTDRGRQRDGVGEKDRGRSERGEIEADRERGERDRGGERG